MGRFVPTVTEQEIIDILARFRVMGDDQVFVLLTRNGKSEAKVNNALRELYMEGYVAFNKEHRYWKISKTEEASPSYISLIWAMMENTNGSDNELKIYKQTYVDMARRLFSYVKDGKMYYLLFLQNAASRATVAELENALDDRGADDTKSLVRLLLVSEREEVFGFETKYDSYNILLRRDGKGGTGFEIV